MEVKEFLNGVLSKTLNMDEAGVASLFNEDGTIKDESVSQVLKLDVERIAGIKPDTKKYFDDGYKKAQSEILSKRDKELVEKFGIKSDKIGVELVNEIVAEQIKKAGVDLNDEAVKKHPLFISTVDKLSKEKEEAIAAESNKLIEFQKELKGKETFSNVAKNAISIFENLKPVLPTDSKKAENQKALLIDKLSTYQYDIQGDKIIVLQDGKVKEDEHGNRIPFDKIVKDTADMYFEFHKTEPKSAPGNGQQKANAQQAPSTLEAPKSHQDFLDTIANSKIPATERVQYEKEYGAKFSANI